MSLTHAETITSEIKHVPVKDTLFTQVISVLAKEIYEDAVKRGWWEGTRNDGECLALMHSELSEGLEALRHGNPPSDHIPNFSGIEEELADVIIRILDYAEANHLRIGAAIETKVQFNKTREYKHGGKKF
jgi:NTP pyrophosphatase (non-canonical NTP hydrolase)